MFRYLLSGVALTLMTASTLPAQDWARRMFAVTEHNFGSVARGAKAEYAFVLTNQYQDDVHIASVRASCGCTSPYIADNKQTLKSYEQGAIIAHLNSDRYIGQRAATLTVTFDRPLYAEVQLQISALVHTNLLMEPESLRLGPVPQGKGGEARVRLYRADFPNWEITGIQLSDPNLQGEVIPLARQDGQVWYDVSVRLSPKAPPGYISDYAVLTTNDPQMSRVPVQVEGQVMPNVVVSPSDLFLGVVQAGQTVTKPLIVRADRPFHIKSVTGDKRSFKMPPPSDEAKSVQVVRVTFVAGADVGKVVKTIHIDTDIGDVQATSYAVVNQAPK